MTIKLLAIPFVILMIGLMSGCNTIQGAGEDIEAGGEKIQDSAK